MEEILEKIEQEFQVEKGHLEIIRKGIKKLK